MPANCIIIDSDLKTQNYEEHIPTIKANSSSTPFYFPGISCLLQSLWPTNIGHFIFDFAFPPYYTSLSFGHSQGRVDRVIGNHPHMYSKKNQPWYDVFIGGYAKDWFLRDRFEKVSKPEYCKHN